jgi:NHL repeat
MKLFAAIFTACLLTACGGGGSGGDPAAGVACAPFIDSFGQEVSCADMNILPGSELAYLEPGGGDGGSGDGGGDGSAGDGAPIAHAVLRFTDVNGRVVTATTDKDGRFRINLRGLQAPLVATVVRDNKPWKSMLVADIVRAPASRKFYTINLTGLTDYVVSEVAKKDGLAGPDAITPAAVARQKAQVPLIIAALNTQLAAQITTAGLSASSFDPLTKPFQAVLMDSYDKLLESLSVIRSPTGPTLITPVYTLGGSISGLGSASGLSLVNGTETLRIAANASTFVFASKLAQGTKYDIKVGTQPVGLTCNVVSNGQAEMGSSAVSNVAVACGTTTAATYALGGTVTGLGSATGLQLSNGGQSLGIAPNQSSFAFAEGLLPGVSYSVTVQSQPAGLTCSVAGGVGTMGAAAVNSVAVTCVGNSYPVGGSVTGLSAGGLVLSNGGQTVNVASGASSFMFPNPVAVGSAYNVTVQTQPATVTCSVSNGTGTVAAGPVNDVVVTCSSRSFTLGGSVTGLSAGGLVLSSGGQTVDVASGATSFMFPSGLASGTSYNVTVQAQPATLTCSVSNAAGIITTLPVGNVVVTCSPRSFTLGGTVTGLTAGGLLLFSGALGLDVPANASTFVFRTALASGSTYRVIVEVQPTGLICTVGNGSGTVAAANVTNVVVICSAVAPLPTVSTLAGNGSPGFVNGSGAAASFAQPSGVGVDASGNVYVADQVNHAIRKISPAGLVSTLAGRGKPGFVDGSGAAASFNNPSGIAVDSNGNLYVADTTNHAIRQITPAGLVSTLAGNNGVPGFVDGAGVAASFNNPVGVAVDGSGNVYVADSSNHAIRRINPKGVVTTLAGNGSRGFVNGTGTAARFNNPTGVAVDSGGSVYVADYGNLLIRKISPAGVVVYLAGSGIAGFVNGVGVEASFNNPTGVAVDSSGNVYVADQLNNVIRKINPVNVVSTLVGSGKPGFVEGSGAAASFNSPAGVTVDNSGNLFVADLLNHAIRKIVP